MAVYNSSVGLCEDDSDITIINPSIIHEEMYVPIVTRLKQANNLSENRQVSSLKTDENISSPQIAGGRHEYIFVDHDSQENAKQLEEVLKYYIRDMKEETRTQLECDRGLTIRLMNLIRPAYSSDQKKLIQLDEIMKEIGSLHDKRYIEQKEKIDKLIVENRDLMKKSLSISDPSINTITNDSISYMSYSKNTTPTIDQSQWTEIQDDIEKLHTIIQSQKDQIDEIQKLISEYARTVNYPLDHSNDKEPMKDIRKRTINSLLEKIKNITGHNGPTLPTSSQETTLENRSPGTSPSESLNTLIGETFEQPKQVEETEKEDDKPIRNPEASVSTAIPLTPTVPKESKKCPICNQEFAPTMNEVDMYEHVDNCLFPAVNTVPNDYECPNCNQKFPNSDEVAYHQHLSDCFNRLP